MSSSSKYPIVVRACDCDPIVVIGFNPPGDFKLVVESLSGDRVPENVLRNVALVRWDHKKFPGSQVYDKIKRLFNDEIGECSGYKARTPAPPDDVIRGFMMLTFKNEGKAKEAEDTYNGEKALAETIPLHVRGLEHRKSDIRMFRFDESVNLYIKVAPHGTSLLSLVSEIPFSPPA